jgi:DNA-binding NarL/FixJ family response regulator
VDRQIDVLIADDQIKTRQGLKALLRFSPFVNMIWEAEDGEAAMRIVSDVKPDVVIMDVQMPVLSGLKATRWIKQNWPEVKVIILTMYPYNEEDALAAGADCFLVKGDKTYSIQDVILSLFSTEKINDDFQHD